MSVQVHIQLQGGHQHRITLDRDDPAIAVIMTAMAEIAHPGATHNTPDLVRLVGRNEAGEDSALVFPKRALVSIATTPPLIDALPTIHDRRRQTWLRTIAAAGTIPTEPPRVARRPNFLPADVRQQVFQWILDHQSEFRASGVRSRPANQHEARRTAARVPRTRASGDGPWSPRSLQSAHR